MSPVFQKQIAAFNSEHHILSLQQKAFDHQNTYLRLWVAPAFKPLEFTDIACVANKWQCLYYVSSKGKYRRVTVPLSPPEWNVFLQVLLQNDILHLPDESKLTWDLYGWVRGEKRRSYIMDDWFYYFEILHLGKFNAFSYHSHEFHSWPEAKKVCNILRKHRRIRELGRRNAGLKRD